MIGFCINLIFLITLTKSFSGYALSVTGYCGDPGLPERSKRIPDQNLYNEDEKITYSCEDHISLKQFKQCLKGKWRGEHPICGMAHNS